MGKTLWLKDDRQKMKTNTYEVFHNYTDQQINLDFHTHDFYEVLVYLKGDVSYTVEDKTYPLKSGDIILTNNSEIHRANILSDAPYERFVGWFHPEFVQNLSLSFPDIDLSTCFQSTSKMHYNLLRADSQTYHKIIDLFNQLLLPSSDAFGNTMLQHCYVAELLILLNQAHQNTTLTPGIHVISNPKINDIIYYINQHLSDDLSLDFLTQQFYISKYYLTRLFKQYTGLSLHQYVLKKRLIAARSLLMNGGKPYDVYIDIGFNSYPHFSKSFKDEFGIAPSDLNKTLE